MKFTNGIDPDFLLSIYISLDFDKSHKGYQEKDVKENTWQEIASALDFLSTGKSY